MRVLQPAEWSKPRGFSHGVVVDGPGKWVVLAGQTGGDEKGDYAPDLASQVGTAMKRIMKLLREAGAGPEHQPDIMVLSLTTQNGIQDFAFNKEQALLIAKTIKETATKLEKPKTS